MVLLSFLAPILALQTAMPPNVVLIVADDLGYGDVGCYGSPDIRTPFIDGLAWDGVRMTDGYVTAPVCGPSRAGLMTGRHQNRFGFEFNLDKTVASNEDIGIPPSERLLPERMKAAGYATGMVGKWHLGMRPGFLPNERGFDSFFGFLEGGSGYLPGGLTPMATIYQNTTPVTVDQYLTDEFTRRAVNYIDGNADKPFFLYVSYNAPHWPLQTTAKYRSRYPNLSGKRQTLAGMISAMDDGVGAIRQAVARNGLTNRTLVLFLSDNGGRLPNEASNDPLSGGKNMVFEGGVRVPFIASMPGRLPNGSVYSHPVSSLDLVPTIMGVAGSPIRKAEKLEGVTLMPYWKGKVTEPPHFGLYWRYGNQRAARIGREKFMRYLDGTTTKFVQKLYDLSTDIGETTDLKVQRPDRHAEIRQNWWKWDADNVSPMWPNPAEG